MKFVESNRNLQPLAVRCFEGLELNALGVERDDFGAEGYALPP